MKKSINFRLDTSFVSPIDGMELILVYEPSRAYSVQVFGFSRVESHVCRCRITRYVKSLNIDPIREADMLWIAEDASPAQLYTERLQVWSFYVSLPALCRLWNQTRDSVLPPSPGIQCSFATWMDRASGLHFEHRFSSSLSNSHWRHFVGASSCRLHLARMSSAEYTSIMAPLVSLPGSRMA